MDISIGRKILLIWPEFHLTDKDECLEAAHQGINICEMDENSQCLNLEGSYECSCVSGYLNVNGTCQRKTYYFARYNIIILKMLILIIE